MLIMHYKICSNIRFSASYLLGNFRNPLHCSFKKSVSVGLSNEKITRESRCLVGDPKHFPFAIVSVFIIKRTLTCMRAFLKKWQLRWPPRRNIISEYPCAVGILAATSSGFLTVRLVEKSYSLVILLGKIANVNLTILASFFAITQSKIIAATFRNMEKTRLDELYIYVGNDFLLK